MVVSLPSIGSLAGTSSRSGGCCPRYLQGMSLASCCCSTLQRDAVTWGPGGRPRIEMRFSLLLGPQPPAFYPIFGGYRSLLHAPRVAHLPGCLRRSGAKAPLRRCLDVLGHGCPYGCAHLLRAIASRQ